MKKQKKTKNTQKTAMSIFYIQYMVPAVLLASSEMVLLEG